MNLNKINIIVFCFLVLMATPSFGEQPKIFHANSQKELFEKLDKITLDTVNKVKKGHELYDFGSFRKHDFTIGDKHFYVSVVRITYEDFRGWLYHKDVNIFFWLIDGNEASLFSRFTTDSIRVLDLKVKNKYITIESADEDGNGTTYYTFYFDGNKFYLHQYSYEDIYFNEQSNQMDMSTKDTVIYYRADKNNNKKIEMNDVTTELLDSLRDIHYRNEWNISK